MVWVKEQMLVAPLAALYPVVPCHWTEEGIWEGAIPPCALHLSHDFLSFLPFAHSTSFPVMSWSLTASLSLVLTYQP